ncbi:MAG: hypothetical protein ACKVRO_03235 [Micropepsaceae bacterium]
MRWDVIAAAALVVALGLVANGLIGRYSAVAGNGTSFFVVDGLTGEWRHCYAMGQVAEQMGRANQVDSQNCIKPGGGTYD